MKHKLEYEGQKSVGKKDEVDIGEEEELIIRQDSSILWDDDKGLDISMRSIAKIPTILDNNSFKYIPKDELLNGISGKAA